MRPVYIALLLIALLLWRTNTETLSGACVKCPTAACPPGPGNGFYTDEFYTQYANAAGLDPAKLSLCNNHWYYDGKFTCVRGIDPTARCPRSTSVCVTGMSVDGLPSGSYCGDPGTTGSVECQFAAVKWAVDNGLHAVSCPLLN